MAGGRNLKASTLHFLGSFLFGSATTYLGLFNFKSPSKEPSGVNNIADNEPKSSGQLCDYPYGIWKHVFHQSAVSSVIDYFLADISASQWQDKLTKEISKGLSSQWACQSGLTQKLLQVLQEHNTRQTRKHLTNLIGSLEVFAEKDCVEILSSCDERVLIGLARLPYLSSKILDSFNRITKKDDKCNLAGPMENHLKTLLLSLPLSGLDACTKWFTKSAFLTGTTDVKHKRLLSWSFGGDSSLSFAHNFTSMPPEQVELYYLKALTRHSMISSHSQIMVEKGILPILYEELIHRKNNHRITHEIAHIIGNLALDPVTHSDIVKHGFLPVLRTWLFSEDLSLSTHAGRALANLDHDWSPRECYEDGVYVLHPDKRESGTSIDADVVFVHGLRGGPLKTWRTEGTKSMLTAEQCWPKGWLVKDFPNVRVIMVEYDSSLSHWVSECPTQPETRSLAFRSDQIMKKLHKAGVGTRPVIWITHSMGGLLVKQLLLHTQNDEIYRSLCDHTKGIVFYSTPHKGSALASYSSQARYFLLPSIEVKELCQGSPYLSDLHSKFTTLVDSKHLECLSFGEQIPINLSWIWNSVLVDVDSAYIGYGQYHSLDTNHINVCKPINADDPRYQYTKDFIQQILQS